VLVLERKTNERNLEMKWKNTRGVLFVGIPILGFAALAFLAVETVKVFAHRPSVSGSEVRYSYTESGAAKTVTRTLKDGTTESITDADGSGVIGDHPDDCYKILNPKDNEGIAYYRDYIVTIPKWGGVVSMRRTFALSEAKKKFNAWKRGALEQAASSKPSE
jgi:hypothetical protein